MNQQPDPGAVAVCEHCHGKGLIEMSNGEHDLCDDCDGSGKSAAICPICRHSSRLHPENNNGVMSCCGCEAYKTHTPAPPPADKSMDEMRMRSIEMFRRETINNTEDNKDEDCPSGHTLTVGYDEDGNPILRAFGTAADGDETLEAAWKFLDWWAEGNDATILETRKKVVARLRTELAEKEARLKQLTTPVFVGPDTWGCAVCKGSHPMSEKECPRAKHPASLESDEKA